MFGFNEENLQKGLRSCERDFQLIALGLSYECASKGIPADSFEGAICGQAIHYILWGELDKNINEVKDKEKKEKLKNSKVEIKTKAWEILHNDEHLRYIIVYLLTFYASLRCREYGRDQGGQFKFSVTDDWARIEEIVIFCGIECNLENIYLEQPEMLNKKKFLISYKEFLKHHGLGFWRRTFLIFFRD